MVLGWNTLRGGTEAALRGFLHAPESSRHFRLLLPEFHGSATLNDEPLPSIFSYRGSTFAERDARAASHVQSLLNQVVDVGNVTLEGAGAAIDLNDVTFLFGSRSNHATQAMLRRLQTTLFQFEFTDTWAVICGGQRFSLGDPTVLPQPLYEAADDYGVIARVRSAGPAPVFVIAGLGGRATEGCGVYFREHWDEMDREYGAQDFAVVLRFPAPFDVARVERAASASEPPRAGF
jgi:hypothetical protein